MRNRVLHDALRDFALEAAACLVRLNEGGEELGFSLEAQAGGGGTLYRYRPLTDEFIERHWDELRALPGFEAAARALGTGARAYLRRRGEPGADAEPALRAMLERLYEEGTSFSFPEERFERVYAGVERALYAGTVRVRIAAPLLGVTLEGARVDLGEDLALVDVALLAPAPSLPWAEEEGEATPPPTTYLLLERDLPSDAPLPLGEARIRLGRALTALRLLREGGAALASLAFARADEGPWQGVRLPTSGGEPHGPRVQLPSEDGEALRDLVEALEESPLPGRVGWALRRFELGLARDSELDALSDYLLAARALLGPGPRAEPATVALRVAALRAGESDRRAVQRRVEAAFALEPFLVEGGLTAARGPRYDETVGRYGPQALVRELEEHLRGLLASVVLGELDPDLAGVADDILLRSGGPVEVRAARGPGGGDVGNGWPRPRLRAVVEPDPAREDDDDPEREDDDDPELEDADDFDLEGAEADPERYSAPV